MPGILDYLQSTLLGGGPVATQGGQILPIDQQPPSFLSRIADGLSRNSNALTGFGMGLLSGASDPQNGWRNAALGYQTGVQNDQRAALLQQAQSEKLAKQRAAIEFSKKYPQYGGLIAANPDIAETFAKAEFDKKLNPDKPSLFERMTPEQQKIYLQRTAEGDTSGGEGPKITERLKYGQALGLKGEDLNRYALTGKMDDPQNKALPAELAARVGLAESFLANAPRLREAIAAGDSTGPIDGAAGFLGVGKAGEIKRKIASGKDALIRNLTGAGMPASEADQYSSRYDISPTDSTETALSKFDNLIQELQAIRQKAYQGRQRMPDITPNAAFGQYDRQRATTGKTSSGVSWGVVE